MNVFMEVKGEKVFGARPLRRAIQKRIQDPLSVEILKDKFKDGDSIEIMLGKNKKELFGFKRI